MQISPPRVFQTEFRKRNVLSIGSFPGHFAYNMFLLWKFLFGVLIRSIYSNRLPIPIFTIEW